MTAAAQDHPDVQRRSDARRNHERIIAAAIEVFAEKGLDASVPDVAARAGVGKATVYRNYPTKAELVAAVANDRLLWLAARADRANVQPDAYAELRAYAEDVVTHVKSDRALCEALTDSGTPGADVVRGRIRSVMGALLDRGKTQGTIRSDATYDDLRILLGGVTEQLHRDGETDRAVWRHYAGLVVDSLRAPAAVAPARQAAGRR